VAVRLVQAAAGTLVISYDNGQGTITPVDDTGWDRDEPMWFNSSAELIQNLEKVGMPSGSARQVSAEMRQTWDTTYGPSQTRY
jgi:hypothetical protein